MVKILYFNQEHHLKTTEKLNKNMIVILL